jgi:hypothetical protein
LGLKVDFALESLSDIDEGEEYLSDFRRSGGKALAFL